MGRTSIRSHLSLAPALGVLQESAAPGFALPPACQRSPRRCCWAAVALQSACGRCAGRGHRRTAVRRLYGATLHAAARPAPAAPPETAAPIAAASPRRSGHGSAPASPKRRRRAHPDPTPQPRSWTISFDGDCTIGKLLMRDVRAANNLCSSWGGLRLSAFQCARLLCGDDFTLVNFEGTFTESLSPVAKAYRFSAPARYAAVLTDGGVEE
jgi:hypothetical protein